MGYSLKCKGVPRGSVIMYLTRNPGVLGSSCTGSSGSILGVSSGKTLQSQSLVFVKPRKDLNNINCGRHMTEMLKAVKNTSQYRTQIRFVF